MRWIGNGYTDHIYYGKKIQNCHENDEILFFSHFILDKK